MGVHMLKIMYNICRSLSCHKTITYIIIFSTCYNFVNSISVRFKTFFCVIKRKCVNKISKVYQELEILNSTNSLRAKWVRSTAHTHTRSLARSHTFKWVLINSMPFIVFVDEVLCVYCIYSSYVWLSMKYEINKSTLNKCEHNKLRI